MGPFDSRVDRSAESAAKYEEMEARFGAPGLKAFWIADMDFAVCPAIAEAIEKRARQPTFGYTTRPDAYFEALSEWYARRHGVRIDPARMLHSPGVVTSLNVAVERYSSPGDGIIIQPPVYYPFYDCVSRAGRTVLENPLVRSGRDYAMDFDGLEALAGEASMLVLCNPHNPVGRAWRRDELERLAETCSRHGIRIVSDEIHADLVFDGARYVSMLDVGGIHRDTTITLLSATKTFNVAGLQASFVVVPGRKDFEVFDEFFTTYDLKRNNCFSLVAVEAGLRHGEPWLEEMLAYVRANMRYVRDFCASQVPECVPNLPESTYLQWVDCRGLGLDDTSLGRFMVAEAGLAVSLGAKFGTGGSGHVRLNLACPRSMVIEAMESLAAAVRRRREQGKGRD